MVNMTLSIPEELYKEMQLHSELKWSEVARQAFEHKIRELHWMDKLVEKSELSEEDVHKIGKKIKAGIRKRIEEQIK
jgi:hypothetical protein